MSHPSLLVGKTYCVRTFGCQMNLHDSERVSGLLDECGCLCVEEPDDADIVVFMTCCVRENADQRLYGQASAMVSAPTPPSGKRVVAIGGCIAQRDGEKIREHIPCADVVFGTSALASLPALLAEAFESEGHPIEVDVVEEGRPFSTDLPSHRAQRFHAWVPIMTGCNNFCTYCIVPYVRGREKSRTMESIVSEVELLVADGVREVTLLGQNVNSYGRNIYGEPRFAELLRRVGETGIERIRFTSSNPKDLSDETIRAMAEVPSVMPHLHLAVQSGSSRILKAMNRSYTREDYLALVERLREGVPGLALSTDIIVGFPGETEEDFLDTLSLVKEASFSSAYTFIYSRRPGTPAAKIPDDTPHEVIQDRFDRLAAQVADQAHEANQKDLGTLACVLVEGSSKRDSSIMVGHSEKNQTVHFAVPEGVSPETLVGSLVDVRVEEARTWYLRGTVEGEPR
ncbi:tRNA (N6-isopentenyl adenosine(37)-C2)-methylthiotransferase MiaB [Thermophilibacter provencensis]|uniref:tRNA-2-methylthio-N(6)-dimethylallyladenosine synthase n=1 Tax=Thermophilibacter provencensis TaxID=1852386 RepID=A0ABT7V345_9ACTN|nr:tRNA (N6-isopentenyl adenosine(37)-C2)-methylthiotransferase MiaB [Thermophilibacter provencensis]MDM8271012.1 tRNA (N6-isopentenyl adenosine(37)-C2)-methylthiotransferase MiaB [Thermophilibacter provencensis]